MVGTIEAKDLLERLGFESVNVGIVSDDAMLSIPLDKNGMRFLNQDSTMASLVKTFRVSLEGVTKAGKEEGVLQLVCLYKVNDKDNVTDEEIRVTHEMTDPLLAALLLSENNPIVTTGIGLTTDNENWIANNGELLSNIVVFLADCLKKYLKITGQGEVGTTFITHTGLDGFGDVLHKAGYEAAKISNDKEDFTNIVWVDNITTGNSKFLQVEEVKSGLATSDVEEYMVDDEGTSSSSIITMPTLEPDENEDKDIFDDEE